MDSAQSRANKAKGRTAENQVVEYLTSRGYTGVERRRLAGVNDKGDIAGIRDLVIEVKAQRSINLASFVDEANTEAANVGGIGVAWIKRRGKGSPKDWYVAMDGETFIKFLNSWQR